MPARLFLVARFVAIAVVLAAKPAAAAAQQSPTSAAPAGAGTIVIILDSLETPPRTLSELLRDYVPAASVQRSSGALGAGAWVSLRDASVIRGDDPLVVVDGIRQVSYRSRLDTLNRRAPSLLDDIMLDDVARVEVLSGPAAAASYGNDGQRGVIVVTTRAVGHGRPEVRASLTTSAADNNAGYSRNLSRVTALGTACPYYWESAGGCTATSTTRYTPLLDRSPFRAAQQARAHISASGALGALGYAASLGSERGTGTMNADAADRTGASLRLNLAVARSVRVGLAAFATERGVTTPVEGSSSLVALGRGGGPIDCSPATPCGLDSSSGGYRDRPAAWAEQQRGPHRRIDRLGQAVTVEIDRWSRLALRTTASADLLRDKVGTLDSTPAWSTVTSYSQARAKERNWRVGGMQEALLTTNLGPAIGTTTVSARFESERSRDDRSEAHSLSPGPPPYQGGVYATSSAGVWLRRSRLEWALDQHFALGDRASIGAGAIRTSTKLWKQFAHLSAVTDPHADAMYEVVPTGAPLGILASLRLRTAWAQTSGYDGRGYADVRGLGILPPTYIFGSGGAPEPPRYDPDRSAEFEAGFDAAFSPASSRLSLTIFRKRETVHTLFPIVVTANNVNAALSRRVTGGELVAEATPIDVSGARLRLRGHFATNHDRVSGSPLNYVTFAGYPDIGLSIADGESFAAWRSQAVTWNDANGDGRIDLTEIQAGAFTGANGRSRPSRVASLMSSLEFARAFALTTIVDHVGGFEVYDMTSALQCAGLVCPALNDPKASLSDQARAVAISSRSSRAGFLVPGDAVRLRELSLSYQSPRAATTLRASALRLTLSAYDVASWTRSMGAHPETDMPAPGDRENVLWSAVQPIPRTLGLRVALVY